MFDNIHIGGIESIVFTKAKTTIPGVKAEYYKYGNGVKFHFWKDPEFPDDFGDKISAAFSGFREENIIVEYVPEVDSWYGEVKNLNILTDLLIEKLVDKISVVVTKNGKE
jgi:hypothetical protein